MVVREVLAFRGRVFSGFPVTECDEHLDMFWKLWTTHTQTHHSSPLFVNQTSIDWGPEAHAHAG